MRLRPRVKIMTGDGNPSALEGESIPCSHASHKGLGFYRLTQTLHNEIDVKIRRWYGPHVMLTHCPCWRSRLALEEVLAAICHPTLSSHITSLFTGKRYGQESDLFGLSPAINRTPCSRRK